MSDEWNALSQEKKQPFLDETEGQKRRYEAEMKVYKAKKAAEPQPKPEAKKPAKPAPKKDDKLVGKKKTAKSKDKDSKPAAKKPTTAKKPAEKKSKTP